MWGTSVDWNALTPGHIIPGFALIAGWAGSGDESGSRGFTLSAVTAESIQDTHNRQVSGANSKCH
jgi:hypothetical protein